jgi:hypothetical protein
MPHYGSLPESELELLRRILAAARRDVEESKAVAAETVLAVRASRRQLAGQEMNTRRESRTAGGRETGTGTGGVA